MPERRASGGEPVASRPSMPGYGILPANAGGGLLPWDWAVERLQRAHNYWVATTRPDGSPHLAAVWGVWFDGAVCFSTGGRSRKARNLAADPRVAVHLESGDDAVMLEGTAERPSLDAAAHGRVVAAYAAKYDMKPEDLPGPEGWYALRASRAFAWQERDFPNTATRWRF